MFGLSFGAMRRPSSAPLPTVVSASNVALAGGVTQVAITNGLAGDVINVDGVDRLTLSGSTSPVAVTVPAHAAGVVNVVIKRGGYTSPSVSLAYVNVTFPGTLNLLAWEDSRDWVPATYPAQPSCPGRVSLGVSGDRKIYRYSTATANPSLVTVDGKSLVKHANSPLALVTNAAPTVPLAHQAVLPIGSYSGSIVFAVTTAFPAAPAVPTAENVPLVSPAYNVSGVSTFGAKVGLSSTGIVHSNIPTGASYTNNAAQAVSLNDVYIVQFYFDDPGNTMGCRVGNLTTGVIGSWTTTALADQRSTSPLAFIIGDRPYSTTNYADFAWGEHLFSGDVWSTTGGGTFDQILARAQLTANWGP